MLLRSVIAPLTFGAAILSACSPAAPPDRSVAVVGDSPQEIAHGIAVARATGRVPLFVQIRCTIGTGARDALFSPYAQILRTRSTLIARAYERIYLFPIASSTVTFNGANVPPNALPLVDAPELTEAAQAHSCPSLEENAAENAAMTDAWNALKDPWQTGPAMVPWTAGAQLDAQSTYEGKHP